MPDKKQQPPKKKKIIIKDERLQSKIVKDNIETPVFNKKNIKPLTEAEKKEKAKQEIISKQGQITQHTPQSILSKTKEIALNPMTAFGYVARNEELPENFSKGKRASVDYAVDLINPAQYVEDTKNVVQGTVKGDLTQVGEGLLGVVPMGLEAKNIYKGINNLGNKYLPNTYKLNPFAKKAENFNNPNSFYRQIDDETFKEGLESGLIRGKQNVDKTSGESIINLNKSFGDDAYYKKSSLYSPQRADYIYEVQKGEEAFIPKLNNRTKGLTVENTPIRVSREPIPLNEANIYQKDWLQGYKKIKIPNTNFALGGEISTDPKNKRLNYENELMSRVITERNKNLNFVQRGLNSNEYPKIVNNDNTVSTHELGYVTDDNGNAYVRPNIVQNKLGLLERLNNSEATKHSFNTGETIKIPDVELADYYSKNGLIKHALGGNIQQTNNMNNITTYNEGGLHETNPNGGIPMGQSPEGQMNTVEQGEARMGDMIYSNRIPLSQEAVEAVGLPRKFIGKTPGDILSLIDKTFKGRNDQPSQATKKDIADKVAQAQEMIKAQQEAMQTQSQEVPDMMNGEIPEGMNQFVEGGDITQSTLPLAGLDDLAGGLTSLAVGNKDQALTQGIKGGLTLAGTAVGGPIGGMIAGTIADIGTGFINKEKAKKEAQKQAIVDAKIQSSQFTSDFKLGGNMYEGEGPLGFRKSTSTIPQVGAPIGKILPTVMNQNIRRQVTPVNSLKVDNKTFTANGPVLTDKSQLPQIGQSTTTENKFNWKKVGDEVKKNYPHLLRAAPVAMNLAELARLKKNGYDKVNPVLNDTRFKPEYIDEKSVTNLANSEMNNSINAISQSGGSQGAVRSALLGAGLNRNKALSQAMIDAQAKNIATDQFGQQFNNANTEANIQRMGIAEDLTARNKGAYETNRSKLVGQMGTDIGSIGKEEVFKKIAENMTGYDWLGNYLKLNPNATEQEIKDAYALEQKSKKNPFQNRPAVDTSPITAGAYGGKMKFKKY